MRKSPVSTHEQRADTRLSVETTTSNYIRIHCRTNATYVCNGLDRIPVSKIDYLE